MADHVQNVDLLVRNAFVITMDSGGSVFPSGALAVKRGRLTHVGADRSIVNLVEPRQVIDAHGGVVHPGFVDTHVHATHALLRAPCPDGMDWDAMVQSLMIPYWNAIDDIHELYGGLVACLEMIRSGTTCFIEPGTVFEPSTLVEAASKVGIRALVPDGFIGDLGVRTQLRRAPQNTDEAIARLGGQIYLNDSQDALVRGCIALTGSGTASDPLMLAAKEAATKHSVVLTAHQSWHLHDRLTEEFRFRQSPIRHYEQLGVLDELTLLSHMNHIEPSELDSLVRTRASVSWSPVVGGLWTTEGGVSRHAAMRRVGVVVGLGTDGTVLGTVLDLTGPARLSVIQSRAGGLGSHALVAMEAFEMMTIGGATAIGMSDEIGSLTPGKAADFVIRAQDAVGMPEHGDIFAQLVYPGASRGVSSVFVNGRPVLLDGSFTQVDEFAIRDSAAHTARELMKTLDWPSRGDDPLD